MDHIRKIIRKIIEEIHLTGHFDERLDDRLENIKTIDFPTELHQEFNKNNSNKDGISIKISDYKPYILNLIKNDIKKKVNFFKILKNKEGDILYIYVLSKVLIKYKGKLYSPTLYSVDESKLNGNIWYTGVFNDSATTLLLGNNDDDIDLKNKFKQHLSKKEYAAEKIPGDKITGDLKKHIESDQFEGRTEIKRLDGYIITIDLDKIISDKTSESPLSIPTEKKEIIWNPSYKKGAKFQHDKFGEGTIVSSKYLGLINLKPTYNVEIKFDEPYGIKTIKMIKTLK